MDVYALYTSGFFDDVFVRAYVQGQSKQRLLLWAGCLILRAMMHFDADFEFMAAIEGIFASSSSRSNGSETGRVDCDDAAGTSAFIAGSEISQVLLKMGVRTHHVQQLVLSKGREM